MLKGYRVQMERKDNRTGKKKNLFLIEKNLFLLVKNVI